MLVLSMLEHSLPLKVADAVAMLTCSAGVLQVGSLRWKWRFTLSLRL